MQKAQGAVQNLAKSLKAAHEDYDKMDKVDEAWDEFLDAAGRWLLWGSFWFYPKKISLNTYNAGKGVFSGWAL